jgi:hypothetical protein
MTNYEMTDQDWAEFAAQIDPRPKPEPAPAAKPQKIGEQEEVEGVSQFASRTPVSPPQAPTPKAPEPVPVLDPPIQIRSADEFLAEHYRKGDSRAPEASAASELFQPLPLSLPMRNRATGSPPALGRHQPPVRVEIAELRREIAELARILGELTRIVGEIHALVLARGR